VAFFTFWGRGRVFLAPTVGLKKDETHVRHGLVADDMLATRQENRRRFDRDCAVKVAMCASSGDNILSQSRKIGSEVQRGRVPGLCRIRFNLHFTGFWARTRELRLKNQEKQFIGGLQAFNI
jgi:hypothetical protein